MLKPKLFLPLLYGLICSLLLLLSGCGSIKQQTDSSIDTSAALSPSTKIKQLLEQAGDIQGSMSYKLQLQAADLLIQTHQQNLAKQLLLKIPQIELEQQNLGMYSSLFSHLLLAEGEADHALNLLNSEQLVLINDLLPLELQIQLSDLRAQALSLRGSHLAAAQERIYIEPLLDNAEQIQRNREAIWQSFMYLDKNKLADYLLTAIAQDYRGWLELAIIAKNNQTDLDQQVAQIDDWLMRWPTHPAALELPGGMALLKEIAASSPGQIALLLPLSGQVGAAGQAVHDGFLAEFFKAEQTAEKHLSIRIYDTEKTDDFIALYRKAVDEGAELIIGPLTKHRVRLLFDEVTLPAPTLALNHIIDYGAAPDNLYQFSLAATEESRQVARLAALEQHKNALLLITDNNWAHKAATAFTEQWEQLDGKVLDQGLLAKLKDYSSVVKHQFHLDHSNQRKRNLSRLINLPIEFEARRRQDIDMIFLLAQPRQARSIKPLLDFHYGSDIPVYSTSQLYSGTPKLKRDKDLEGIKFTDMPWILSQENKTRQSIQNSPQFTPVYLRLYALGIDLYRLYPRLRQLEQLPQSRLYGETGTLSMRHRVMARQLMWAQITRGKVKVLPMISANSVLQEKKHYDFSKSEITEEADFKW